MADEQALVQLATHSAEGMTRLALVTREAMEHMTQYQDVVETAQTRSTNLMQQVTKDLEGLQSEGDSFLSQFEQQLQDTVQDIRDLKEYADTAFGELASLLNQNAAALKQVQEQVGQEQQKYLSAIQACQEGAQPLHKIFDFVQTQTQKLEAEVDAKREALVEAYAAARTDVGKMVNDLKNAVDEAKDTAQKELKSFEDKANSSRTKLQEKLDAIASDKVKSAVSDIMERTTSSINNKALKSIDRAVEEVREEVTVLSGKMTDASEDSNIIRRELQPIIDEVEDLLSPIQSAIDHAKSIVDSVPGVSWD
jgi:ElaB/YqjD/DUF883 family membrane-anchored ribosome-binding protein